MPHHPNRLQMSSWELIAELARLAPTPHNTQPFRIRPRDATTAEIVALTERFLPREDHGNRYVASAFGVFAAAMSRAAQHHGLSLHVTPRTDIVPARITDSARVTLGTAHITGWCDSQAAELLSARRTSRLPYHEKIVPAWALERFATVAASSGHRFTSYDDRHVVKDLLLLNANAIIDNLQLDAERKEIEGWYRYGPTPKFGDGLWERPLNQPAWELRRAFGAPHLFTLPVAHRFAVERYMDTQRGTRHIGLLCGEFDSWPSLVRAGEMLMEFWLELARADVYMQPMGSMLTNPKYAREVARRFGVDDCWLVFRFGYSSVPPRAPRLQTIPRSFVWDLSRRDVREPVPALLPGAGAQGRPRSRPVRQPPAQLALRARRRTAAGRRSLPAGVRPRLRGVRRHRPAHWRWTH